MIMRRSRFKVEVKKNQSFGLNITSMTDMFTIMLVFLLQSFATSEVQIDPVQGLRLPTSVSDRNLVDGVIISISPTELKIDQKIVALVNNKDIEKASIDPTDRNFIRPLFTELEKLNKEYEAKKDIKLGRVLLQADQDLPYSTLRKIMYTASMAGFPNLKLITMVGN
jgi:biopolymer transport protein ExbD